MCPIKPTPGRGYTIYLPNTRHFGRLNSVYTWTDNKDVLCRIKTLHGTGSLPADGCCGLFHAADGCYVTTHKRIRTRVIPPDQLT